MSHKKNIILIIGLPGSGKTTLSKILSNKYNIPYFSTEEIRAELLKIVNVANDCDFTEEQAKTVYEIIVNKVQDALIESNYVIVEGVFRYKQQRQMIYNIQNARTHCFYIYCEENITIKRLKFRKMCHTISPAGVITYKKIKRQYEFPCKNENFITIDNSNSIEKSIENIINNIRINKYEYINI